MKKRTAKKLRKIEQLTGRETRAQLVVFDLEATCWEPEEPERVEILEIGAVKLKAVPGCGEGEAAAEFSEVVRPVVTPALSAFCLGLIPIGQADADAADPFPAVFGRFLEWIGDEAFWLGSWGSFDRTQLQAECKRHGLALPPGFAGYLDLRREFARWKHVRPPGLRAALEQSGLAVEGTQHRALDDARNLTRLARTLLAHNSKEDPGDKYAH